MVVDDGDKRLAKDEREGDPVEGVRHHALSVENPLEPPLYGRQDARLQSLSTLHPVAPRSEEVVRRMMRLSDLPCELLLVRCVRQHIGEDLSRRLLSQSKLVNVLLPREEHRWVQHPLSCGTKPLR